MCFCRNAPPKGESATRKASAGDSASCNNTNFLLTTRQQSSTNNLCVNSPSSNTQNCSQDIDSISESTCHNDNQPDLPLISATATTTTATNNNNNIDYSQHLIYFTPTPLSPIYEPDSESITSPTASPIHVNLTPDPSGPFVPTNHETPKSRFTNNQKQCDRYQYQNNKKVMWFHDDDESDDTALKIQDSTKEHIEMENCIGNQTAGSSGAPTPIGSNSTLKSVFSVISPSTVSNKLFGNLWSSSISQSDPTPPIVTVNNDAIISHPFRPKIRKIEILPWPSTKNNEGQMTDICIGDKLEVGLSGGGQLPSCDIAKRRKYQLLIHVPPSNFSPISLTISLNPILLSSRCYLIFPLSYFDRLYFCSVCSVELDVVGIKTPMRFYLNFSSFFLCCIFIHSYILQIMFAA